jgi:hypothetical protein
MAPICSQEHQYPVYPSQLSITFTNKRNHYLNVDLYLYGQMLIHPLLSSELMARFKKLQMQ